MYDMPHRAGPAPGLPEGHQADQTREPGLLREMSREGIVLPGGPPGRSCDPRGEIRLLAMPLSPPAGGGMMDRRSFLRKLLSSLVLSGGVLGGFFRILPPWGEAEEEPAGKLWGFGVSGGKGIGCGRCVGAGQGENDVPQGPFFSR